MHAPYHEKIVPVFYGPDHTENSRIHARKNRNRARIKKTRATRVSQHRRPQNPSENLFCQTPILNGFFV
jgi:hypothetical protein